MYIPVYTYIHIYIYIYILSWSARAHSLVYHTVPVATTVAAALILALAVPPYIRCQYAH